MSKSSILSQQGLFNTPEERMRQEKIGRIIKKLREKSSSSFPDLSQLDLNPIIQKNRRIMNQLQKSKKGKSSTQISRFINNELSEKQQEENATLFMKYLDHCYEKDQSRNIIKKVEDMVQQKHLIKSSYETKGLQSQKQKDAQISDFQRNFFKDFKKYLLDHINYVDQGYKENIQIVNQLLLFLQSSNPSLINRQRFKNYSFSNELEFQKTHHSKHFLSYQKLLLLNQQKTQILQPEKQVDSNTNKDNEQFRQAIREALQLKSKPKNSRLLLKKQQQNLEGKPFLEKKIKVTNEEIIFAKINPKRSEVQQSIQLQNQKYAYIYQLPYNIVQSEALQLMNYFKKSRGISIQDYFLFPYKNFFERLEKTIIYHMPDEFDTNSRILKIFEAGDQKLTREQEVIKRKRGKNGHGKRKNIYDIPMQNQIGNSKLKSVTDALLLKIKRENYSKYNKSSIVIKFSSPQQKRKILTPQSRLYGLNFKQFKNIKLEEGFSKNLITLTEIPWGCNSKDLQAFLNQSLAPLGLEITHEEFILTKNHIHIQYDYLTQALQALKKLNNIQFQEKRLKAQLSYGPCTIYNKKYKYGLQDSYEALKRKIEESSAFYSKLYEDRTIKNDLKFQ